MARADIFQELFDTGMAKDEVCADGGSLGIGQGIGEFGGDRGQQQVVQKSDLAGEVHSYSAASLA